MKKIFIIILVLLIILGGIYFYDFEFQNKKSVVNEATGDKQEESLEKSNTKIENNSEITLDYYIDPIELDGLIDVHEYGSKYRNYLIGYTTEGERIILLHEREGSDYFNIYIEKEDGTFVKDNSLPGLSSPVEIQVEGMSFTRILYVGFFNELLNSDRIDELEKIKDVQGNPFYKMTINTSDPDLERFHFVLVTKDGVAHFYELDQIESILDSNIDSKKSSLDLGDKKMSLALYDTCRIAYDYVKEDVINEESIISVGYLNNGQEIFRLESQDSVLYEKLYSNIYEPEISKEKFEQNVIVLLLKNNLGLYSVYVEEEYIPMSGCGSNTAVNIIELE